MCVCVKDMLVILSDRSFPFLLASLGSMKHVQLGNIRDTHSYSHTRVNSGREIMCYNAVGLQCYPDELIKCCQCTHGTNDNELGC